MAVDDAVLAAEERKLIENTIEFGDTVVREVMVPRPDMVTVSSDFKVGDVMEIVILNGFSRLPVSGDGIDDIVGVVHAKDLMRAERDGKSDVPVTDYLRPAIFVPETKKVPPLLREMQAQRYHMAIVIDEYGGTAGLVTLEDLIEELVGEIVDEYDVEDPQLERLPSGELRVNARMNIDDLNELLHGALPEGDWDSVGGLLIALLGHVPAEGRRPTSTAINSGPNGSMGGASGGLSSARSSHELSIRVLHARWPAERREVDAAELDPRHQGHDRLGQATDNAHPSAWGAAPPRLRRSCSSTRPASTNRALCSASGSTTRRPVPSRMSTRCAS